MAREWRNRRNYVGGREVNEDEELSQREDVDGEREVRRGEETAVGDRRGKNSALFSFSREKLAISRRLLYGSTASRGYCRGNCPGRIFTADSGNYSEQAASDHSVQILPRFRNFGISNLHRDTVFALYCVIRLRVPPRYLPAHVLEINHA